VAAPAKRMKTMRDRRRAKGLRELRLVLPDARSSSVQQRVATEVARLRRACEDEVAVAAAGDDGKPRPAVVVQTDAFPDTHTSVVVCQLTSVVVDAPDFRITIDPSDANGLRMRSQIMADNPVTVRRERVGRKIGRLAINDVRRLNAALALVMGLAD
jgi:mRNA interferase MazF